MGNTVQILERYWREHPAWFGRSYGEYLHLGANQELLRLVLLGVEVDVDSRVLDLSCALGGNARWFAAAYGCRVDGIDSFKPAVLAARELARAQGLAGRCRFEVVAADELPWSEPVFDLAVTTEGETSWTELGRVLKKGGHVIGTSVASGGQEAFLQRLTEAGFEIEQASDVTQYAVAFYRAKEEEAKLLLESGLTNENDLLALQMHTIDLYEAGGAQHVAFRARRL